MSNTLGLESLLVKDRWILKKKVGNGTFCEMFLARSILPFEADKPIEGQVAIKLQTGDIEKSSILRSEAEIVKALSGLSTTPRFIKVGKHENREYMVMELLGGEDMAHLRDRIRVNSGLRCIALPGAIFLAQQMLKCIKNIHHRGYVHRDIKPANFIRRTHDSTDFVMVDFGITKQYRDQQGNMRPKREQCDFRGTAQYASPFAHQGHDQCPRDDLLGLVLVFFDLICGKLPWLEMVRIKDRRAVTDSKQTFFAEPTKLTKYVYETTKAEMQKCPAGSRYDNFPALAQDNSLNIIKYLMNLSYESVPDYDKINHWFSEMLNIDERQVGHETRWEDIANHHYNFRGFTWGGGVDKRVPNEDPLSTDPTQIQEIALSAMKYLHRYLCTVMKDVAEEEKKDKEDARKSASSSSVSSTSALDHDEDSDNELKRKRAKVETVGESYDAPPPPAPPSWAGNSPVVSSSHWENTPQSQGESQHIAIKRESPAPSSSASGAGTPRKDKGGLEATYPELSDMTPREVVLNIWRGIVNHLCSVQIAHLQKDKIIAIRKLVEKHNFFLDDNLFSNTGNTLKRPKFSPRGVKTENGVAARRLENEIEVKIREANAIFCKIDVDVCGLYPSKSI